MNKWSKESAEELYSCESPLIQLFTAVLSGYDCSAIYGHRGEELQNRLYDEKKSMVMYPDSKHNSFPSKAVDIQPCPINIKALDNGDLKEWGRFYNFIGYVRGVARYLEINVRTGSDWDGDFNLKDQNFDDLWHWELV